MKKITLHFPSLASLVKFQSVSKTASFRIIITTISIIGAFSDEEIQLARNEFNARVVVPESELESSHS